MFFTTKKCRNCNRNLEGSYGRIPITFRFCPACGTDSTQKSQPTIHGLFYWWALELAHVPYFFGMLFFMGIHVASILTLISYSLNRMISRHCNNCLTVSCSFTHDFCHNCGRKLKRSITIGKLKP